jgi:hypothetical protein
MKSFQSFIGETYYAQISFVGNGFWKISSSRR